MKTAKVNMFLSHKLIEESNMDLEKHHRMIDTQLDYRLGVLIKDECYSHTDINEDGYHFTRHIHTISDVEVMKLKTLLNHGELRPHAAIVIHEILKES
jgi:hypothetical protein